MVYDGLLIIAMALTTTGVANLFAPRPLPEGAETVSLEGMQTGGPLLGSLLFVQTFAFAFFWLRYGRTSACRPGICGPWIVTATASP